MLTRDQLIQLLHQERAYLSAEFGVRRIGLFGSYATGQPDETSDVDLVVEFERPMGFRFLEVVDYLEAVLGRKVDVLTPAGIQNIRSQPVAKRIMESIVYV
ncbi:MAG: nucleotidyltransferase family protein [Candidatus Competibacteraceae bacterium]